MGVNIVVIQIEGMNNWFDFFISIKEDINNNNNKKLNKQQSKPLLSASGQINVVIS